mmetsp:Transcript_25870/g.30488  ORF Transcript_25870/g.30488 Transcript_25870/m.30488 type:complete len:90 (-) Transcript_25870:45-314(-)
MRLAISPLLLLATTCCRRRWATCEMELWEEWRILRERSWCFMVSTRFCVSAALPERHTQHVDDSAMGDDDEDDDVVIAVVDVVVGSDAL